MSSLRQKIEGNWFFSICIVCVGIAAVVTGILSWIVIYPQNMMLSEKNDEIKKLIQEKLFLRSQLDSFEEKYQNHVEKITTDTRAKLEKELTASLNRSKQESQDRFKHEIEMLNRTIGVLQPNLEDCRSSLQNMKIDLNIVKKDYQIEKRKSMRLEASLKSSDHKKHILLEISDLKQTIRTLFSQRTSHLQELEKLMPVVAENEVKCGKGDYGYIYEDFCIQAANAHLSLEKERSNILFIEKQIDQKNEQVLALERGL